MSASDLPHLPGLPDPRDPLIVALQETGGRRLVKAVTDLERHLSPAEMQALARALPTGHPARPVLLHRDGIAGLVGARRVAPFAREEVTEDVSFYTAGGPRHGKTLILGFGGMGGRLGLPVWLILQALDPACHDLALLRDPANRGFVFGAGRFAPSLAALAAAAADRFRPESYRRLVCLGNSMGAAPALRAGRLLDAERAVGLGTRLPNDALLTLQRRTPGPAFDMFCECLNAARQRGLLVHAERCALDAKAARHFARLGAGRVVSFSGMDAHNLVHRFWTMGELGAFLRLLLDGDLPHDQGARARPVRIGRFWPPRLRAGLRRRLGALRA